MPQGRLASTTRRAGFVAIVPPALKHPGALVAVTGVLELLGQRPCSSQSGGAPLRVGAVWGLAALLVAVFPAHVHASRARRSAHAPNTPLPRRTAMQGIFIAATLFVALAS